MPALSLTRQLLLNPPKKVVAVELLDGRVAHLTRIAESDLAAYDSALFNEEGKIDRAGYESQRRRLLALCLCDADGQLLFSAGEHDLLRTMDGPEAEAIFNTYNSHFRVKRPSIRSLEKKSEPADESGSPSASAAN